MIFDHTGSNYNGADVGTEVEVSTLRDNSTIY